MKEGEELRKIVREILLEEYVYIIEGIDVDERNKTVSFNPAHENNVNTSIAINPTYDSIDGFPVISIFKRKYSKDSSYDGNPLIYALKGLNGWKFKNPQKDIIGLLRQFIRISEKIKPEYDTIITIPSSNELNINFLHRLNKIIKTKAQITDWLFKLDAEHVYEDYIDWQQINKDNPNDYNIIKNQINQSFKRMIKDNDSNFSFKYIEPKLRKYITKTMEGFVDDTILYAPYINGKDILVLDDTISSGPSISGACKIIMETFQPKSITVITLFSKL